MSATKIYAEEVNYWQTSQKAADTWIDDAIDEIKAISGKVLGYAYGTQSDGRSAFMMEFSLDDERFKIIWPVLPSKTGKDRAAKVQAATALYHDVKARCVTVKFMGKRQAFFNYLVLPDGRTAAQATGDELVKLTPQLFMLPSGG